MRRLLSTAAATLLLLPGCAPIGRMNHPDALLRQYVEFMEQGNIDGAYDLLSEAQRQRMSRDEFRQAAEQHPDEVGAQARELRRQMTEPIPVTAELRLPRGDVATLVLQEGRWRVAEGAAGAVSLSSPLQTLRALRRALLRRSYTAVIRTLSRDARASIEDEISRITESLRDEESLTVEVTGNRARIVYDEGHFIELEREDGEWVIVDLD